MTESTDIRFFATPPEWRQWLEMYHATVTELWVGYYKKGSGLPSITLPESVAEALCFGWIDGLRKTIDDSSYKIRFTPRKTSSIWSAVNMKTAEALIASGRMEPAGLRAFAARKQEKSAIYAYEQEGSLLSEQVETALRANPDAWAFFTTQAPWYQRTASHWVMSAKREETRHKRLATLVEDSAQGRTIGPLTRK